MGVIVSKGKIILLAIALSIIMYIAGVFSGLYANKITEHKVSENLGKVQNDIDFLRRYVDSGSLDLKNMLLLQSFSNEMEDSCQFAELYLNHLSTQLQSYWDQLPAQMEAVDKELEAQPEYITAKREYTRLSLRIWLSAWKTYQQCPDSAYIPILYFYTKGCTECISQINAIADLKNQAAKQDKKIIIFSIDESFEDDTVYLLKQYYNFMNYPAFVLGNQVFKNQTVSKEDLRSILE